MVNQPLGPRLARLYPTLVTAFPSPLRYLEALEPY